MSHRRTTGDGISAHRPLLGWRVIMSPAPRPNALGYGLLFLAALAATGCGRPRSLDPVGEIDKDTESWTGSGMDQLVAVWGEPTESSALPDGQLLNYRHDVVGPDGVARFCNVSFFADARSKTVRSSAWTGHS